jgi:hypothetical protein
VGAVKAQKAETETAKKPEKAKAAAEAEAKPAKQGEVAEQCQPPLLSLTQQNDTAIGISGDGADAERAPPQKKQKTEVRVNARPTTHGCTYPGKTV